MWSFLLCILVALLGKACTHVCVCECVPNEANVENLTTIYGFKILSIIQTIKSKVIFKVNVSFPVGSSFYNECTLHSRQSLTAQIKRADWLHAEGYSIAECWSEG